MNSGNTLLFSSGKMQSMFFLVITLIFFIILISCQSKVSTDIPPEIAGKKVIPVLDADNFETTFNDSGIIRYHLKTPRILIFPERKDPKREAYYEFPKGFHVQKYDENHKIESEMSANYGKYFNVIGKWYASGNVVMINSKGDTLRTEELNYDEKQDLIYSDRFVSIRKGDQDFTGTEGFKSDAQMTKWTFKKTQGHVFVEDE